MDVSGSMQGAGGVGGLMSVNDGSATYYPCYDGNGNVSEYVDATGVVVAHYEYDAFGQAVASGTKAGGFSHQFSTKQLDAETELYYYGYRYYDAGNGRWLARDPIVELGGLNIYGFVANKPIKEWDLLGLTLTQKEFKNVCCCYSVTFKAISGIGGLWTNENRTYSPGVTKNWRGLRRRGASSPSVKVKVENTGRGLGIGGCDTQVTSASLRVSEFPRTGSNKPVTKVGRHKVQMKNIHNAATFKVDGKWHFMSSSFPQYKTDVSGGASGSYLLVTLTLRNNTNGGGKPLSCKLTQRESTDEKSFNSNDCVHVCAQPQC